MTEKSKLFKTGGYGLGLKEVRRTHRGWIAKNLIPRLEKFELAGFAKKLVNLTPRTLRVNDGENTFYL